MRKTTLLSLAGLGAALLAGGVFLAPSFAQDKPARLVDGQTWLSIPQLAAKLDAAGFRNIEKIEREHGGYEVRASNRDGKRVKLYLDPYTGEINPRHGNRHDDKEMHGKDMHGKDMHGDSDGRRGNADCNERRCRDDLPQAATIAPPARR